MAMGKKFLKRSYFFTPQLLKAWAEFHAPSKDYSPSAAGAFLVWMALEPDIREKARQAALMSDTKKAIEKVKKMLSDSLVDAEIKDELAKLTAERAKLPMGAQKTARMVRG